MINYAVVGAGWFSQVAFLPGVAHSGNSRVAAIVTGDRAKAARLADFYGIGMVVGYDGYDALLASPGIDAVYIALPNHMHADCAIRAARAGKHVMVEKPLAVNEDEALAMIAAARDANVFLMTAYRLHHEPGTVAVLEHIRANAIGRPLFFQSVFSFQTSADNHRLRAMAWGGRFRTSASIASTPPVTSLRKSRSRPQRQRTGRPTTRALARSTPRWQRRCDFPQAASHNSSPASGQRQSTITGSWGRRAIWNSTLDSGSRPRHGCGCDATARSSRPSFRRSTILARRLGISRIASVGNAA